MLASAGAQCDHINHVSTQIPYVLCVAGCCVIGYLAAGITQNGWIGTLTGLLVLAVVLVIWIGRIIRSLRQALTERISKKS
ncbi:MAG: Na+/H+ antiporter NhaC family protein [Eisenbergiella sp.]